MKHEGEDLFFLARTKVAQGTVAKCTTAARIPHYVPCGSIYVGRIKINNWGRQTVLSTARLGIFQTKDLVTPVASVNLNTYVGYRESLYDFLKLVSVHKRKVLDLSGNNIAFIWQL